MNIIHVFPSGHQHAADFADMLVRQAATWHADNISVSMHMATTYEEFVQQCAKDWPDVVHVHGQLPFALPHDCRMVVSPHGCSDLPTGAYVVVARSAMECSRLGGRHPRIEIVRDPLITRTITAQACFHQLLSVYQRVTDSDVWPLMLPSTRHFLTAVLAVAIGGDANWAMVSPDGSLPPVPSTQELRRLSIYASHEGIMPLVEYGLQLLAIKDVLPSPSDGYLPVDFVVPKPMPVATISELLSDIDAHGPSMLRLTELATALRSNSLDEEKLISSLNDSNQLSLLSALLPLLSERMLLTEGFMPCPPTNNAQSKALQKQLVERQKVV